MRLLWLPSVLRAAGLTVHEYQGWKTRGSESFGPVRGITCHGTAGSVRSTDAGELRTLVTGSTSAKPPIAQLYLSRSGEVWVVASGTCNHNKTGWGGPNEGYGNDSLLGIEAQHHPAEPWTDVQYRAYVRLVAALVAHRADGYDVTVGRVAGHGEHQPGAKTDPWFDMTKFRRDVAEWLTRRKPEGEIVGWFGRVEGDPTVYWMVPGEDLVPMLPGTWETTCVPLIKAGVPELVYQSKAALVAGLGEKRARQVSLTPDAVRALAEALNGSRPTGG